MDRSLRVIGRPRPGVATTRSSFSRARKHHVLIGCRLLARQRHIRCQPSLTPKTSPCHPGHNHRPMHANGTRPASNRPSIKPPPGQPSPSRIQTAPSRERRPARPVHIHDRLRIGAVCGPSQPTQQHATTNNDADQRGVLPLVSIALVTWTSALLGLLEDLVDLKSHALAGRADLRDGRPSESEPPAERVEGAGVPSASPRATTRQLGAEPDNARGGSIEGCPRAGARSG